MQTRPPSCAVKTHALCALAIALWGCHGEAPVAPRLSGPAAAGAEAALIVSAEPATRLADAPDGGFAAPGLEGAAAAAARVCPYVQGPLLEWLLLDAFEAELVEGDREIARRVRAEVEGASDGAHDEGARRFVVEVMRCEVVGVVALEGGRARVSVRQQRPTLREPTEAVEALARGASAEAWAAAFEGAWRGASEPWDGVEAGALTLRWEGGAWRLEVDLARRVWGPLRRQQALDQLEGLVGGRRWASAREALAHVCGSQALAGECARWRALVEAGEARARETAGVLGETRAEVEGGARQVHGRLMVAVRLRPARSAAWLDVQGRDAFGRAVGEAQPCALRPGADGVGACEVRSLEVGVARWEVSLREVEP